MVSNRRLSTMNTTVIVITEEDMEYGYDIYVDVVSSIEDALSVCNKVNKRRYGDKYIIGFNSDNTQIGIIRDDKFYSTLFTLRHKILVI